MNWKLKGTIQNALSRIPGGMSCNYLLQRTAGSLRNDAMLHRTFRDDVTVLFERIARLGVVPSSTRVFEIGTGWMPILPLSLHLAGFRDIYTVDLYRHLREPLIRRTLLALGEHLSHPCFQAFANRDVIDARYQRLLNAPHILEAASICYLAPCDASQTGLKPGSLDLIISNNVFEHVPEPALHALFREAKRVLRPNGHVLHCVNCGDHYAYSDPAITQLNYLQFSDDDWKRWNNDLHFQNRLRARDFVEMADRAGLAIFSAETFVNPAWLKQVEQMELAPRFRRYKPEELAATSLTLIASA